MERSRRKNESWVGLLPTTTSTTQLLPTYLPCCCCNMKVISSLPIPPAAPLLCLTCPSWTKKAGVWKEGRKEEGQFSFLPSPALSSFLKSGGGGERSAVLVPTRRKMKEKEIVSRWRRRRGDGREEKNLIKRIEKCEVYSEEEKKEKAFRLLRRPCPSFLHLPVATATAKVSLPDISIAAIAFSLSLSLRRAFVTMDKERKRGQLWRQI